MDTIGFIAIFDFAFLVAVIIAVIWIFSALSGYGGMVGKSFEIVGWGTVIMGVSHIIEVISLNLPGHHEAYLIIFAHHFFAAFGFIMIAYGFNILMKK
jgi:hypothetical protein